MKKVLDVYRIFCIDFPAFSPCVSALLSIGCGLSKNFILFLLAICYFFLEVLNVRKLYVPLFLNLLIFVGMYFYAGFQSEDFDKEIPATKGSCYFHISSAKKYLRYGRSSIIYTGQVSNFQNDQLALKPFESRLLLKHQKPLKLDKKYKLEQIFLEKKSQHMACIKTNKESLLIPIGPLSLPIAKFRYQLQRKVSQILAKNIHDKKVRNLLKALSLGYSDNQMIAFEFSRLGLQHLLAISGFHFALLSLTISLALKKLFSIKTTCLILIFFMTCYLLYIGNSASIKRAYIAILIHLTGHFLSLKPRALNSLCLSCLILLIINPLELRSLGFQLSYAATFGILTLFKPTFDLCNQWIRTRQFDEALSFSAIEKLIYIFLMVIKSSCAINLAVSVTTVPIILGQIGLFPPFSLLYNMIIPVGVSLSMTLLIISFSLSFVPVLAKIIFWTNEIITKSYLILISNPPFLFASAIHYKLPKEAVITIFTLTFIPAMLYHYHKTPLRLEGSAKSLLT